MPLRHTITLPSQLLQATRKDRQHVIPPTNKRVICLLFLLRVAPPFHLRRTMRRVTSLPQRGTVDGPMRFPTPRLQSRVETLRNPESSGYAITTSHPPVHCRELPLNPEPRCMLRSFPFLICCFRRKTHGELLLSDCVHSFGDARTPAYYCSIPLESVLDSEFPRLGQAHPPHRAPPSQASRLMHISTRAPDDPSSRTA